MLYISGIDKFGKVCVTNTIDMSESVYTKQQLLESLSQSGVVIHGLFADASGVNFCVLPKESFLKSVVKNSVNESEYAMKVSYNCPYCSCVFESWEMYNNLPKVNGSRNYCPRCKEEFLNK